MSKSRHTEAQMIAALKQGGAGRSSDLAYRRMFPGGKMLLREVRFITSPLDMLP
jgi:hypothetical protein